MTDPVVPRRGLIIGTLALTLTALAGCTHDDDPGSDPAPRPSEQRYDKPATLPKLSISNGPSWGSKQAGIGAIGDIILSGDIAVIAGRVGSEDSERQVIKVVDAQTGKTRWTKVMLKPIGPSRPETLHQPDIAVVDDGRDGLVLVHYFSSECSSGMCRPGTVEHTDEQGVAALSLADGSVRWTHPIIPAVKAGSDKARKLKGHTLQLVTGLTRVGLVITGPSSGINGNEYVEPGSTRTVALDPKTGKESWSTVDAVARRVVEDTVMASHPAQGQAGQRRTGMGGPLALDLRTGKEVWNRSEEFRDSNVATVSGGQVIIQLIKTNLIKGQELLSVIDGKTHLSLPKTAPILIGDEGGSLFASYSINDASLVTLAPEEHQPIEAVHPAKDVFQVAAVHGGYLLATARAADAEENVTIAYDRSGNQLSDPIPGTVMKATDTAMITRSQSKTNGAGYDQFSVYLLQS